MQGSHPTEQNAGREGLTDPSESQGTKRDAELDGGKKVVEILLEGAYGTGSWDACGEHLLNARVANGNQGELRGHKEGVGQNEHGDSDKLQER
jgi:hypothetical protein